MVSLEYYLEGTDDEQGEKEENILPPEEGECSKCSNYSHTALHTAPGTIPPSSSGKKDGRAWYRSPIHLRPTISTIINRGYVEEQYRIVENL